MAVYSELSVKLAALLLKDKLWSFNFLVLQYTEILVYLNSSLNPFLYCWKISEVQQAVKETIREVLCSPWSYTLYFL